MQTLSEKILGKTHWLIPKDNNPKTNYEKYLETTRLGNVINKKTFALGLHYPQESLEGALDAHVNKHGWSLEHNSYLHKRYLGGEIDPPLERATHNIDLHLRHHPAPMNFNVFTGLGGNPFKKKGKGKFGVHITGRNPDKSIKAHLPAFTSTSIDPTVAEDFSTETPGKHKHILKIHIPKGSEHGRFVGHVSRFELEHEFLLNKGKNLKIHPKPEYYKKDGHHYFIWHAHIED